jgi:hypothetical protein
MTAMHEFYLVTPFNILAAMKAWKEDHAESAQMAMLAVADTLKAIKQRGNSPRALECMCLDCDFRFSDKHKPFAFGIVLPMFPIERVAIIAHGICFECFNRNDLHEQIERTLREIFPRGQFGKVEFMQ